MLNVIKELCEINAPSGSENAVAKYLISHLPNDCEWKIDSLGNLIVHKLGKQKSMHRVMLDAHMDEVGLIINSIIADGLLRFSTIGGIDPSVIISRQVLIQNEVVGVVCSKPVHMMSNDEKSEIPEIEDLYIDIGAGNAKVANSLVGAGDVAVFNTPFEKLPDGKIMSKALDDRVGCAILLDILNNFDEFDYYATFTVQEEVGLRGAKTATYTVAPEYAITLEATTAADIAGVPQDKQVCRLGLGAAVSYMDGATLYNKELFHSALKTAEECNIPCQVKALPSGGNNAGAIHLSRGGVKTLAISVPCRYIHSPSGVCDIADILSARRLAETMLCKMAEGKV